MGERLGRELEGRLQAAEAAADELGQAAFDDPDGLVETVRRLRRRYGVTALALFGPSGDLRVWDGSHRGRVPEEVQRGLRRYWYGDLSLFGYLYVTAPAMDQGTAMAAILLRTDLPGPMGADAGDFAAQFRDEVGESVRIVRPEAGVEEGGWDLTLGDRTLLSVVLEPPERSVRTREILERWRLVVGALALASWLLLAAGGLPRVASGAVAATALVVLAGALPFHLLGPLALLFDGDRFRLPGLPLSLGRLAALALAGVTLVAVLPRPRRRLPPALAGIVAAVAIPLLVGWVSRGAAAGALAEGEMLWIVFQGTLGVLLIVLTGTLLVLAPARAERPMWGVAAVLIGALLGVASVAFVRVVGGIPPWWPALWGVPVALGAASMGARPGWQPSLASWVLAGLDRLERLHPVGVGRARRRPPGPGERLSRPARRARGPHPRACALPPGTGGRLPLGVGRTGGRSPLRRLAGERAGRAGGARLADVVVLGRDPRGGAPCRCGRPARGGLRGPGGSGSGSRDPGAALRPRRRPLRAARDAQVGRDPHGGRASLRGPPGRGAAQPPPGRRGHAGASSPHDHHRAGRGHRRSRRVCAGSAPRTDGGRSEHSATPTVRSTPTTPSRFRARGWPPHAPRCSSWRTC